MKYNFLKSTHQVVLKRLGSSTDGGYLVPLECIKNTKILLSFGLNDDWSFEENFKKENSQISVFSYDHTVTRKFWYEYTILSIFYFIKNMRNFSNIYKFIKYKFFFANKSNNYHIKKKIVKKKNAENEISINEIINRHKDKVFLKIDIENDEYRILDSLSNFKKILGFVIEFHYLDLSYEILKKFLIKNQHFKIVHLHPNNMGGIDSNGNPTTIEITFINKEFCKKYKIVKKKFFRKHILDRPNDLKRKDIKIKF